MPNISNILKIFHKLSSLQILRQIFVFVPIKMRLKANCETVQCKVSKRLCRTNNRILDDLKYNVQTSIGKIYVHCDMRQWKLNSNDRQNIQCRTCKHNVRKGNCNKNSWMLANTIDNILKCSADFYNAQKSHSTKRIRSKTWQPIYRSQVTKFVHSLFLFSIIKKIVLDECRYSVIFISQTWN